MTALFEWIRKPNETSASGIYDNSKALYSYEFLMCQDNLQSMIDIAIEKNRLIKT